MAVSILDALRNAQMNVENAQKIPGILPLAQAQLNNAVGLLEKGYNIWTLVEPLIDKWGGVENVPDIDDNPDISQDD